MAMALADHKKLHHHALPLLLLGLVLTLLSAASFGYYRDAGLSAEVSVARDLLTQVVHVHPTANGMAQVTVGEPQPSQVGTAAAAGQGSNLTFSFDQ